MHRVLLVLPFALLACAHYRGIAVDSKDRLYIIENTPSGDQVLVCESSGFFLSCRSAPSTSGSLTASVPPPAPPAERAIVWLGTPEKLVEARPILSRWGGRQVVAQAANGETVRGVFLGGTGTEIVVKVGDEVWKRDATEIVSLALDSGATEKR
ncbi:MAG: hypothetical protein FJ087_19965 [Deltaproteobacteria bacterium]|nr:hypothetical protein [Deltaproteobacteria bacterium]